MRIWITKRIWITNLALVALLLASPHRAEVFDEADGKDTEQGQTESCGASAEQAPREQELWEAYVKELGDGPIYCVEVLFRGDTGAEHFTYCRHYVSAAAPAPHGLFRFGVNARGEVTPPADPGRETVNAALEARTVDKKELPLATQTRHVDITLGRNGSRPDDAAIHSGDHVTFLPLPKRPGEPQTVCFDGALFRLELVTAEDVREAGPLRQDAKRFRARIDALRREVLSAGRKRFRQSEENLIGAAYLLRDPELIDGVRNLLNDWIARPPAEVVGHSFPISLMVDCLAALGDERDFTAFHLLKQRVPDMAGDVARPTLELVSRFGAARAMLLIEDLLNNPTPLEDGRMMVLRELDPRIPPFTKGDHFLIETVRRFRLKATCYELHSAREALAALQKTHPLTPDQREKLHTCYLSEHVFPTEAARRQGVELMLDFFKQYQPPANK